MKLIKLNGYINLYAAEPFGEEFKQLFGKSSKEYKGCLKKLETNLRILDHEGLKKALTYQQFEKLGGEDLYSIRYVGKSNPREIFAHVSKSGNIILLAAFKEKSGSDYQKAISKAKDRLKELED